MMSGIPFTAINNAALAVLPDLLREWFPNGKQIGSEFLIGDLRGSPGISLKINTKTGLWADFAGVDKGIDPISLAAAAFHHNDRDAAAKDLGKKMGVYRNGTAVSTSSTSSADTLEVHVCPDQNPPPDKFKHWKHGSPASIWHYRDIAGVLLCVVGRYNITAPDGSPDKVFSPWVYGRRIWTDRKGKIRDITGWHCKAPPKPRALYGLDRLAARPDAPVLICEGEKRGGWPNSDTSISGISA